MYIRRNWNQLGNLGRRWELLRFNQRTPQSWEEYWADQRAYWHADSEDKRRVQLYFDTKDTEANLLAKSRKGYADYCEHLTKWNGLCKSGDTVDVIRTQSDTIVLSTQRHDGRIRDDHLDVEIEFGEERRFLFLRKRYCCEIFTYGTITVLPGLVEAQMGERIGSSRIRTDTVAAGIGWKQSHSMKPGTSSRSTTRHSVWSARSMAARKRLPNS